MAKTLLLSWFVCLLAAVAQAQPAAPSAQTTPPGLLDTMTSTQGTWEQVRDGHYRLTGQAIVELPGQSSRFFADQFDIFRDENRIVASGNVVFTSAEGRITANAVEFDMATGTGTFTQAWGLMSLGPGADRAEFGNDEPDVYFWGETLEKLGQRRYRITAGGFTTCTQPTPRWEVTSATVTLNLDDYAVARNTVLRVKGVPLFYLPVLYYPIQDDQRATGFLLPTYGASTIRGQSLSNAFFWAISRSQDATVFHDWFTRAGQGVGAEYRYVAGPQSAGDVRYYLFNQSQAPVTTGTGAAGLFRESRSFQVAATMTQAITPRLRARARVDYVSDLSTQLLLNQNVARATNPIRTIDMGLSGAWGRVTASGGYQRTEVFSDGNRSQVLGGTPRVSTTLSQTRVVGPVYAGLTADYAYLPNQTLVDGVVTSDQSLGRADLMPTVRVPLSTLTFLTVNSSVTYRTTYYTRSVDNARGLVSSPLSRRYLNLRSTIIGPVLTKVWDTPASTVRQRMKHVIEPTFDVQYLTDIANFRSIPQIVDPTDRIVGGMTQVTYGLNNRLLYRSRPTDASPRGSTREFVTIGVQQTYYSNAEASASDAQYSSRLVNADLSPVALVARVSPTTAVDANARVEYDVSGRGLQTLSLGSSVSARAGSGNLTFSRARSGSSAPTTFVSGSTSLNLLQRRLRGTYALSWNIALGYIQSQAMSLSYLAQCCGFQAEFQNFNFAPGATFTPFQSDRRFNVSFVLAGLGTFSNFFGAFGGQQR